MYQVEASKALLKPKLWARRSARLNVPRNVVMLGLVSMLTDVSSEMVATILPLYLVFSLGASPLALGAIDGTYRGAAALVQVVSGFASDRWRTAQGGRRGGLRDLRRGQGGSGRGRQLDRRDRGDRRLRPDRQGHPHGAARRLDLALFSSKAGLATAFGVHRAMDSAGAMLGPLIAFGILLAAPARFDAVFVVSTLFAVLGVAVLVLTVQGKPKRAPRVDDGTPPPSLRAAIGLVRDRRASSLLLLAAAVLSLTSVSDAMLYVGLQRKIDFEPAVFPLLYVITAVAFMGLAIPVGQLADRVGRVPVLLCRLCPPLRRLRCPADELARLRSADPLPARPRRLLRRHRRGAGGPRRGDPARGAAGERARHADHRGQHRQPGLLGRLRRPLARRSACTGRCWSSPSPWPWRSPPPCRCCCARSGRPCMGSRNGKILAALVVLCVVARRRLRRLRRARPELRRPPTRGPKPEAVLASSDLMVRAVDPSNPQLNGRVYEVDDGKVQPAPATSPASGSTTPPAAASAWAIAPSGVDYDATRSSTRRWRPMNTITLDRAALAGARLRATAATGR